MNTVKETRGEDIETTHQPIHPNPNPKPQPLNPQPTFSS